MRIIVGLGNPGKEYEHTPHNVGFDVVDELAARWSCSLRGRIRFRARTGKARVQGEPAMLVKPAAFMNNSGRPVRALMDYQGAGPEALIVVVDDADLELGRVRVKPGGGSGGHRGLASIIEHVGTRDFVRVRLGIGRRRDENLVRHVLKRFSTEDRARAREMARRAADAVERVVTDGVEAAMNAFNASEPDSGNGAP